jgi:hypothetical protein
MLASSSLRAMRGWPKLAAIAAGSSLGVFGTLWLLLEPAGGFSTIDKALSRGATNYLTLCVVSLAVGIVIAVTRRDKAESRSSAYSVGESRVKANVQQAMSEAHQKVIVIGISLPSFTAEAGLAIARELVQRKVTVDFVFVNPASPVLLQRPVRLYGASQPPAVAAAVSLRTCLRFRGELAKDDAARFRVHLTNLLPACAAVIIDDLCYWHPYLNEYTGATSPYLREEVSGGFGQYVLKHALSVMSADYSFEPAEDCEWSTLMQKLKEDASARTEFTAAEARRIQNNLSS